MRLMHDRTGIQGQRVPIQPESKVEVPLECKEDLNLLRVKLDELNNARLELARLMQVTSHLVTVCNATETASAEIKAKILKSTNIEDSGDWAIDFDDGCLYKVAPVPTSSHRVV